MSADLVHLASGSPRRRELLNQIGVPFQVLQVTVDESVLPGESPEAYVARPPTLTPAAAGQIRPAASAAAVRPAPTTVVLDGRILGKPVDAEDGQRMLLDLSGRTHAVLTAIALANSAGVQSRVSRSEVTFRKITAAEALDYWNSGEPRDKAGAYAIQGRAAVFVKDLHGSYSGVMGLPLYETAELLALAGSAR